MIGGANLMSREMDLSGKKNQVNTECLPAQKYDSV